MKWSPLHTRLVAHRIGDGTIDVHGNAVWNNKHPEEFLALAKKLGIQLRKPVLSDKWGVYKIVIPKTLFEILGKRYGIDGKVLARDTKMLLKVIFKMPEEDRLEALCALIFDDGCIKSWLMVVFEDQHEANARLVLQIWNGIFPKTGTIVESKTPRGTKIFHVYSNINGVIEFDKKLKAIKRKRGDIAGLWRKDADLEKRICIAQSKLANTFRQTQEKTGGWFKLIVKKTREKGTITYAEIRNMLGISRDRTHHLINKMKKNGLLQLKGKTKFSYYTTPKTSLNIK